MPNSNTQTKIENVQQQLQIWEYLLNWCRKQIGPVRQPVDDKPPFQFADSKAQRRFIQRGTPGVEYQRDGTKASILIAGKLYERFKEFIEQDPKPTKEEVRSALWSIRTEAQEVLEYFDREEILLGSPPLWDFAEWDEKRRKEWEQRTDLETWLLGQTFSLQIREPVQGYLSRPATDIRFPFVVHPNRQRERNLSEQNVYWFDGGLNATFFDNVKRQGQRWQKERFQLAIQAPYLLLCNGILRGNTWGNYIAGTIQSELRPSDLKPVLIILVDGVDEETQLSCDDFYCLVLPTPDDSIFDQSDSGLPRRPQLEAMAETFDVQIANISFDPDLVRPEHLGRCKMALIDRQRTVLFPHHNIEIMPETSSDFLSDVLGRDWSVRTINILTLSASDKESHAQAEAQIRRRIEAEDGFIAGGGMAFRRAAPPSEGNWLYGPLCEPSRHIFNNAGINLDAMTTDLMKWMTDIIEKPRHTFRIDEGGQWLENIDAETRDRLEIFDGYDPILILGGEARDLELVTSLAQVRRVFAEAIMMAFQLMLAYLSQPNTWAEEDTQ